MTERTEPTVASFTSSRRSCACGDYQLDDDDDLAASWSWSGQLVGMVHGATACLRQSG